MIPRDSTLDFTAWLRKRGYKAEEPKFLGEALRMRKRATSPLMYVSDPSIGRLVGHTPRSIKLAELFRRQKGVFML